MDCTELIGLAAGALTTASFVPQVVRIARTRSARDVSLHMFLLMATGIFLWLVYGVLVGALPVIAANAVSLALAAAVIAMKLRFG
jgi:MtN3 and saliva related transmembrane protein